MATNSPAPNSPDDPARRVRETWDRLSQTPWRDFYIASHAGWDDPSAWTEQALIDVRSYLTGLGRGWLARRQVLEIGCGVGRLAGLLAPLSEGYTGVDISAGMLDEAKRRCHALPNARFLLGSGAALPIAATDRGYGLVLAVAVFIHCPRELIEGNVRSAWPLLAPGGTFRMQLRVDPTDPEAPLVRPEELRVAEGPLAADEELPLPVPPAAGAPRGAVADAVPAEALALAGHRDYAGHAFRVAEARSLLGAAAPGASVLLHRPAPDLLYAVLSRA